MLSLYYLFDWKFADQKFFVFHKAKCARTINWVRLLEFVQCWIKLNDSFIHLILTNSHNSFQNSITIETGLSDFHKMTAVIKLKFEELKFRIIHYWNYKNFFNNTFREYVLSKLQQISRRTPMPKCDFNKFVICVGALDRFAPQRKYLLE